MKNLMSKNTNNEAAVETAKKKSFVSVLQIMIALFVLFLMPVFSIAAHEEYTIDFGDSHIKGFRGTEATLFLKKSLREQYPWVNVDRLDLRKVILVAKSRHGKGRAALRVGKWSTDMYQVEGMPRKFHDSRHNSFDKLHLRNPSYGSRGPWQIDLRGDFVVRKAVLIVDHHHKKPHRPHHWYGYRW